MISTKPRKPMKRTAMKRGTKRMKSSRPKMTPIRKSARNEECQIRLPGVCNYDTSTTVLCHSNLLEDGKGMRLKAPDHRAAYGCFDCHNVVDRRVPRPAHLTEKEVLDYFEEAILRTNAILRKKGLLHDK